MLMNFIRKVEKINIAMILIYGSIILFELFHSDTNKLLVLLVNLMISLPILLVMNHLMNLEPIVHRSPYYYYTFLALTTLTIYLDGGYTSNMFPILFVLPVLYISVNFSRKGSMGVAFFAITIIWLTIMQDPLLYKLEQVILVTFTLLIIPQIIGLLIKEYTKHMKKLIKASKMPIEDEKLLGQ